MPAEGVMYNKEQKKRFIKDYTNSVNTINVAENVFISLEKYEEKWGADLCTRSKEELQPVIDSIVGLRSNSKWMSLTILKEYVKWCLAMKVPDACDGMLHIEVIGLDKVRTQMVASPLHLQMYLDDVFDKESEETIDNLYRCYFWMAYGGIDEDDTIIIREKDVDLSKMEIKYKTTAVPIYREGLSAFKNAITLTSFAHKHPNYSEIVRRDRIPGDLLMRGVKATMSTYTMRSSVSRLSAKALADEKTELQLSFSRVSLSGLFYRTYERERAGVPANFAGAALHEMKGKNYKLSGREKLKHRQNRKEKVLMDDYQRWKLAFSI